MSGTYFVLSDPLGTCTDDQGSLSLTLEGTKPVSASGRSPGQPAGEVLWWETPDGSVEILTIRAGEEVTGAAIER